MPTHFPHANSIEKGKRREKGMVVFRNKVSRGIIKISIPRHFKSTPFFANKIEGVDHLLSLPIPNPLKEFRKVPSDRFVSTSLGPGNCLAAVGDVEGETIGGGSFRPIGYGFAEHMLMGGHNRFLKRFIPVERKWGNSLHLKKFVCKT